MIWFMCPDLPQASGGVAMIYRSAMALQAAGVEARVWHGDDPQYPDFSCYEVAVSGPEKVLSRGDVLVMPEWQGEQWSRLVDVPVVMFVQGVAPAYCGLSTQALARPGYPGWPQAAAAVCVSEYLMEMMTLMAGDTFCIRRVSVGIDDRLFAPRRKVRKIVYMPRKRADDVRAGIRIARRAGFIPDGWSVAELDGLSLQSVATEMSEAAIFLAGGQHEGFGLPPAEAMAAGCAVVGFTGDASREFMRPDTAWVVRDSDVVSMARALRDTVGGFERSAESFSERVNRGRELVRSRYTLRHQADSWVRFLEELPECAPQAFLTGATVVRHYSSAVERPPLLVRVRARAGRVKQALFP